MFQQSTHVRALQIALRALPWAMLAVSAFFVSSGLSSIAEAELIPDAKLLSTAVATSSPAAATKPISRAGGAPILERNPFDSATGSLNRPVPAPGVPLPVKSLDPLEAPPCEAIYLLGTADSSDPFWSTAIIQGPGEPHGLLRRAGDQVAGRKVAYIGYNPREASPSVWLADAAGLCQVVLFADAPRSRAVQPQKPAPAKQPPPKRRATPLPPDLASKIKRQSATEFAVDRSAVDTIMNGYSALMRGTRVLPVQNAGRVTGVRLVGVQPGTLLEKLGLQAGDEVQSINGYALTSPEQALTAYARLRTTSSIRLQIVRSGKPLSFEYRIQ